MITLEFKDGLVNNRFSRWNEYVYAEPMGLNIYYKDSEEEIPFIMRAQRVERAIVKTDEDKFFHPGGEIHFSAYAQQLHRRTLNTNKIKEVLDGAKMPLLFTIGDIKYLIGKGFLAEYIDPNNISILFLAVAKRDVKYIDEVKYYISRNIYLAVHRRLQPVIRDFMALHKGDIVITNNINKFVGSKIPMPIIKTIGEKLKYQKSLRDYCIKEYTKTLSKKEVKMLPVDPKKVKKNKEAEILGAVRESLSVSDTTEEVLRILRERAAVEGPPIFLPDPLSEEAAESGEEYKTTAHAEGLPY